MEQCQWLNRLSAEVWPSYMNPKLSTKFTSVVEVNCYVLLVYMNCTSSKFLSFIDEIITVLAVLFIAEEIEE